MEKNFSVAVIDHSVMVEILEYLVKTKASEIGKFKMYHVDFDFKEGRWFALISSEKPVAKHKILDLFNFKNKKFAIPLVHVVEDKFPIVARLVGREKANPQDSFRLSRNISKIIERKIADEKSERINRKPKKKKIIANKLAFNKEKNS